MSKKEKDNEKKNYKRRETEMIARKKKYDRKEKEKGYIREGWEEITNLIFFKKIVNSMDFFNLWHGY